MPSAHSPTRRILVIGVNSFSGSSFAARALAQGWQVRGVGRSPEPHPCYLPHRWANPTPNAYAYHQLDLRRDAAAIAQLAADESIPYVVNFAALGMVAESWLYPLDYYATNLLGNVGLHEALRKVPNLAKYVHVSTPEVYGDTTGPIAEDAPLNPTTPYAASRAACDIHLKTFLKQHHFPVVWTRAANVYGPGQQPYRIIPRVVLCARLGQRLQLHGGGASIRSFIHIDDVADATLQIMAHATPGETYHLSTDRYLSIRQLAELVCQQLAIPLQSIADIAPERPGKDHAYLLDSSAARQRFHWTDRVPLEDGVAQTIRWADQWLPAIAASPLHYIHKA